MTEPTTTNPNFYGIVDMGSNGIRFSITDLSPPTARLLPTVYQSRAAISLYDAQFSSQTETKSQTKTRGPIPETTIAQVLDHLRHFQSTCSDFGVRATNIHVLATEATRTAPNAAAFCGAIRAHTGWEVRLLTKEEEGRIGALGVASSSARVAGIAMDLGGGSTQITWVVEGDGGEVRTSPRGAFSFPYGAAALSRLLQEAEAETKSSDDGTTALEALKAEMTRQFQTAYRELEVPDPLLLQLLQTSPKGGRQQQQQQQRSLYLCGGGFRGWGYVLMKTYSDKTGEGEAYPIPIINGFRVPRAEFHDTAAVLQEVAGADTTTTKIYGVSRRRAAQIPAVAFLVNVIMDALPAETITHIQFCQGGVREGFLYDRLPPAVRAQDPLLAATQPYAPPSAEVLHDLLRAALPGTPSPRDTDSFNVPRSFLATNLLAALANLLFAHAKVPRESRAAAALHSTATGILAATNCLSHVERALIALVLCERWDGELAPTDEGYQRQLVRCVSREEAWWCRYLGRVAALVGDVYPAGREPEGRWRVRFETEWSAVEKTKNHEVRDVLHLTVRRGDAATTSMLQEILTDRADGLEKVGKKKNWVHGRGVKVQVTIV
ncbi:hypothetical protein ASPACDRAFT_23704 [Aspergillus aculeatus ATCC 16872]|uniref:Ppx/GppA phosphatase domain-containing protein n=1 Tax=Aspergillus aculeatus (strain ATCC 16872 / CBS 172.66 / WB 5094) TaxID=690307 RepID=A0A1L9X2Y2_ASPA1|nr:uncharacterized protein ASPACDRAFT_23704 [Aspergillus aculeatus ATCC 16872]OJK02704.1 hypothetical protein ASPACDRAFT_23704 [Aspergillus aculeatus ATCC 16872]